MNEELSGIAKTTNIRNQNHFPATRDAVQNMCFAFQVFIKFLMHFTFLDNRIGFSWKGFNSIFYLEISLSK